MKFIKPHDANVEVKVFFKEEAPQSFEGNYEEIRFFIHEEGEGTVYFGLGEEEALTTYRLIKAFFTLVKKLKEQNILAVEFILPEALKSDDKLNKIIEGLAQAEYTFDHFKTKKQEAKEFSFSIRGLEDLEAFAQPELHLLEGVDEARELVNLPANVIYPESLAEHVLQLFKDLPVEVEILDLEAIKALKMDAYLAVAQGSDREPRFIVMKYLPKDEKEHITLVGKGMTYDSGGYALKTTPGMVTMKSDMAGAAAVIGTMLALAKNKVDKNVVAVVAAAENMVSGKAFKNGDIISSMKGSSIEVLNTDAEGRLTLADAIYYAATELASSAIIDVATLTGAAIGALGSRVTAMIANDDVFADEVIEASRRADEPTHRLPVFPTHREQIKGKFADLANSTTGGAGAITAGLFLEHFAEDLPWAHLDIAGPSYDGSGYDFLPAGASGTAVKTLYHLVTAHEA